MELQSHAQEYAYIDFSVAPDNTATIEASVDLNTWRALSFDSPQAGKVLLRGPKYPGAPTGLLVSKTAKLWVRISQDPEAIIRSAGEVTLS